MDGREGKHGRKTHLLSHKSLFLSMKNVVLSPWPCPRLTCAGKSGICGAFGGLVGCQWHLGSLWIPGSGGGAAASHKCRVRAAPPPPAPPPPHSLLGMQLPPLGLSPHRGSFVPPQHQRWNGWNICALSILKLTGMSPAQEAQHWLPLEWETPVCCSAQAFLLGGGLSAPEIFNEGMWLRRLERPLKLLASLCR